MNLPSDAPQYIVLLALLVPVITTWITARGQRRQSGVIEEVRSQVANTHSTNLRDDLDVIIEDIRRTRREVSRVRTEISDLRKRQMTFETGVRAHCPQEF